MDKSFLAKLRRKYGNQEFSQRKEYPPEELDSLMEEESKKDQVAVKKALEDNEIMRNRRK